LVEINELYENINYTYFFFVSDLRAPS